MLSQIFGVLCKEIRYGFLRNICVSCSSYRTHYDVLELPRNCSSQDIRNAFIKLSKQYHPDRNATNDENTHSKFVKLHEAYSVLSKPDSRHTYDLSLVPINQQMRQQYGSGGSTVFKDTSLWENRDKSKDAQNMAKPYYGIKGIKKVSNVWILVLCIIVAAVGVSLQVFLLNASYAFSRKAIEEETQRNAQYYSQVRQAALNDGDEAVIKRITKHTKLAFKQSRETKNE